MQKKIRKPSGLFKSWYNCQFCDPSQEKAFLVHQIEPDIIRSRFGYFLAILLFSIFYYLILYVQQGDFQLDIQLIYQLVIITCLVSWLCTYSRAYRSYARQYATLQAAIICAGVLLIILTLPTLAHKLIHSAGLPIAGLFFLLGITWLTALSLAIVFSFFVIFIVFHIRMPLEDYSLGLFNLVGFLLISSIGGNRVETQNRLAFIANRTNTTLIEKLKEKEASLHKLSITDGLTQLFNRWHFDTVGPTKLKEVNRLNSTLHLLTLDLDHFKTYNDHYGHPAGDEALRAIAATLKKTLKRSTDQAFRLGGEEFAIIMLGGSSDDAQQLTQLIHDDIKSLQVTHEKSPTSDVVTVSIGASSSSPGSNVSFEELYNNADKALYLAKNSGRNKTSFY
ncbi:MAG: GGDEF domain-containing protein [Porticoccaceae bacterium]|nr:GGDEF domain-containing protein [Porticoccaceae bacterium]